MLRLKGWLTTVRTRNSAIEKAAQALTDLAMGHISKLSPEEQERRIAAVEHRLARVLSAAVLQSPR